MRNQDLIKESHNRLETWLFNQFPFSFQYQNKDSEDFLDEWIRNIRKEHHSNYNKYTIAYEDPNSNLLSEIELKEYFDYPAYDWVIKFTNNGKNDTGILSEIFPLQLLWSPDTIESFEIHYNKGSDYGIEDFIPKVERLINWVPFTLIGQNGRSSGTFLPFFNVINRNKGIIVGIGWSGQWKCRLIQNQPITNGPAEVMIEAGMEKTHLKLLPTESIRTPRILLYFWEGNVLEHQNKFKELLFNHYSPIKKNSSGVAPLCYPTWGSSSIEEHFERINCMKKHRLEYDYYWVDAGWYIDESETKYEEKYGTWGTWVGRWRPNSKLYPQGLKPLSDAIHNAGMKFLLWLEPERARKNTDLPLEHPEFFLKMNTTSDNLLFNLGDKFAREWLVDFMIDFIEKNGVDCYRQDFNMEPLPYWVQNDAPDRQGISEIRHIEGLYEYWDALIDRFPDLLIDNCASGGRRIDLETIMRSIPLWRSDYQCRLDFDPIGSQIATCGLCQWLPLSGTGTTSRPNDTYNVHSCFSSGLAFHHILDWSQFVEDKYPWDWHRSMISQYRQVQQFYTGNFYQLSNCSESSLDWFVYQLHKSELDSGAIIALRRSKSPYTQAEFILNEMKADKNYVFENIEINIQKVYVGQQLIDKGFKIDIEMPRKSIIFVYHIL